MLHSSLQEHFIRSNFWSRCELDCNCLIRLHGTFLRLANKHSFVHNTLCSLAQRRDNTVAMLSKIRQSHYLSIWRSNSY